MFCSASLSAKLFCISVRASQKCARSCTNSQSWYALLCHLPNTKLLLTCSRAAISDCFNIISCTDCSIRRHAVWNSHNCSVFSAGSSEEGFVFAPGDLGLNWHFSSLSHILFLTLLISALQNLTAGPSANHIAKLFILLSKLTDKLVLHFGMDCKAFNVFDTSSIESHDDYDCMRQRTHYEAAWGFSLIVAEFLILFAPKEGWRLES